MERLEKILKDLGLDDAMAEVFACLAGKKKATLDEIFEDTSLSRKAISMSVRELEASGAVKREGQAYTIEDPREALKSLLPSRYEELKAEIFSYRPVLIKDESPLVEAIRDEASVVPAFTATHIDAALDSVDMVSRSLTWLDDRSLGAARAAVQRGVKVRVITYKHPELFSDARALADAGVEVRSHEYSKDVRFMIVDGEFVSFAIREPPRVTQPAYFGLMIRDRDVCRKMLEYIFEPAWEDAEVVEETK
jgi:sugar-specific transcriptional regulator TrmB